MKKNNSFKIVLFVVGTLLFILVLYFSLNKSVNISLYGLKDLLYKPFYDSNNKSDIIGTNMNIELEEENKELKSISKVSETLSGFNKINATVIERNHSYWMESLTINKGKQDGIDIGMAVVTSEGLVGKVSKITNNTSVVKLITSSDNDNKISVKIKYNDTYVYKVLELENSELVINGVDKTLEFENDTYILTSGLSDIYPSGIVIGKIKSSKNDKYGVSKKIFVHPLVNFDNLRFVTVLERSS